MIYLTYLFFTLVFVYNTPLFDTFIDFIKKKPIIIIVIAIIGDALYMIGGGIIAGLIVNVRLDKFTLFVLINNYGTIMVIIGAVIREYFKVLRKG
ncbi:hypothetical protein [Sulfurimonas sp. NW9]|uniref:hypothetical protein n=1 Tax=Sulfurimonas sp. NW9 TaxID=2922728 RepID=UPI003DA7DD17